MTKTHLESGKVVVAKSDGLCSCCSKCPNRLIHQDYCYNGKSTWECPAFDKLDHPDNEPPDDIVNMLRLC